ncbi:Bro-N domain-containing protein (plasmid) [Candidatus Liberibacter asiaticus]
MSTITPFEFESNKIRTIVDKDQNIWFVAKDVAVALGYERPNNAINAHCKGALKRGTLKTEGGTQKVRIIAEPDVYRLLVKSTLPSAQKFERWVFEEVLPTLRKTGSYSVEAPKLRATSASTVLRVHKHLEELAKQAGLKDNQLLLKVNRGVTKITGVDQLEAMDIKHLPSSDNDEYLTITQIGERLNPPFSARWLNKLLLQLGFQINNLLGGYRPTPKGEERGGKMCDVPMQHVEGSTQQLKWNSNLLVSFLQNELINTPRL